MRAMLALALLAAPTPAFAQEHLAPAPSLIEEVSIDQLRDELTRVSSEDITRLYLARIAAMDRAGPSLRAVIAVNPDALAQARASDARRHAGKSLGPLDGVPILIKDNIETRDPIATTAGSLALKDNVTHRDAPVVARLRASGAVILGKTNLSEWANIRSTKAMSGWSAVGGLVRNPYALDRSACGSSSGTGAAIAASFAAAGVGTETDGSVVCPSSMMGLVGLKPTVGLVSRTYVVPISHSQDTPGPMARSVRDVAILLDAMDGLDPADPAMAQRPQYRAAPPSYESGLATASLKGVRIAVYRPDMPAQETVRFDAALDVLRAQGAVLVEVERPKMKDSDAELTVLLTELHADLDAYLATTPATVKTRTLADIIAFDRTHADAEMPLFAQELFDKAIKLDRMSADYLDARATSLGTAKGAIDAMLKAANATILVQPTYGPAWLSDPVHGDQFTGPSASELPAIAGYPHLTVPMGLVQGLPVGLSFIGPAWSERTLLGAGYVYEQASHARVAPRYLPTVETGATLEGRR